MSRPIISIDPGSAGGIACRDADGAVYAIKMPDVMTGQIDAIRRLSSELPGARAVVERVGCYMPGNSGPAACKFARHCGHIEAALYAYGIPAEQVAPRTWQKALGSMPDEKAERKRYIRDIMARRYPHIDVTLCVADALGILTWAIMREVGNA